MEDYLSFVKQLIQRGITKYGPKKTDLEYNNIELTEKDGRKYIKEEDCTKLTDWLKLSKKERFKIIYNWTCVQKYGEDYFKLHAKNGRKTKEKHFGRNFDKIMMQKAKKSGLSNDPEMIRHNMEKSYLTKIKNYGHQGLSDICRANAMKAVETKRKRYGSNYFHNQGILLYPRILETKLNKYGTNWPTKKPISNFEEEVCDFISSLGVMFQTSVRDILSAGQELDIYIPKYKVAIECDGWFWHSEAVLFHKYLNLNIKDFMESSCKLSLKHYHKTAECRAKGIRLIHILDLFWNNPAKQKILKSIISSAVGIYRERFFARNLTFNELNKQIARDILNTNHIQGAPSFSKAFALFDKDQPIQIMTFQKHSNHKHNECELNRMVTLQNCQVVGGFSKLLKNSMKSIKESDISESCSGCSGCSSYVDLSLFNGKGYLASGFRTIRELRPTYYYIFNQRVFRREFGMRKNIEKLFSQGILSYWNPDETERINMIKNQVPRIYDSGKLKVFYNI